MKGSEVGIAGCSRTLRHVPEIVRMAKEMENYCPNAFLINVTNPLSAITRAVNKYTSIKAAVFNGTESIPRGHEPRPAFHTFILNYM